MSLFCKQESLDEFRTMINILESLNRRLQLKQRKIILFIDDAPCHPASVQDELSNINIVFLPKNTTLKTQPLDSGIIASWKCSYKKIRCCDMFVVKWMDQTVRATMWNLSTCWCLSSGEGWRRMMSQKKQLSNVSKELGCTLIKLTRRTVLLREKNFQDYRNLLRRWKYPVLQKSST